VTRSRGDVLVTPADRGFNRPDGADGRTWPCAGEEPLAHRAVVKLGLDKQED
jgi:hypothetical protein